MSEKHKLYKYVPWQDLWRIRHHLHIRKKKLKLQRHLECCSNDHTIEQKDVTAQHDDFVYMIKIAATDIEGVRDAGDIQILEGRGGMSVGFTCMVDSQMPLREAHAIATNVESKISALSPRICSVSIHTEPFKRDA